MTIKLLIDGARPRRVREPYAGADHAVAEGACPSCKHRDECPGCVANGNDGTTSDWKRCGDCLGRGGGFKVAGTGRRISSDDRAYEADAVALCCEKRVGLLRVETGTLFGVREDEAVMRLGVRIY